MRETDCWDEVKDVERTMAATAIEYMRTAIQILERDVGGLSNDALMHAGVSCANARALLDVIFDSRGYACRSR